MERVLRDGREVTVKAEALVPGDLVLLSAGDLVPADGRLVEAKDFFVNEALLTGEAFPTEKHAIAEGVGGIGDRRRNQCRLHGKLRGQRHGRLSGGGDRAGDAAGRDQHGGCAIAAHRRPSSTGSMSSAC